MLIAAAITVTVLGTVFSLLNPAQGTYRTQPEVSDLQQRMRVSTDALGKDLVMAGGGAYAGGMTGALTNYFAPVMPYRLEDLAASVFFNAAQGAADSADAISLFYVPTTAAQTTIREDMPQPSSELKVEAQANCPPNKTAQLCGFTEGMRAIIFDETGSWDPMTITTSRMRRCTCSTRTRCRSRIRKAPSLRWRRCTPTTCSRTPRRTPFSCATRMASPTCRSSTTS
jgi:hypothetical protein